MSKCDQSVFISCHQAFLLKVLSFIFLDYNVQCKVFSDLVVVDFPKKCERFHILYNVLSVHYSQRVFVHLFCSELSPVPSVEHVFPSANWFEREAWDLFGIHFVGNTDLRRILTDYGFVGHPFRKDFPLSGYTEIYYNSRLETIVHEPISLIQEFRMFDTSTPWSFFEKELGG